MSARHAPVLIFRTRQKGKRENAIAAGTLVVSDSSRFILRVIIRGMYKARDGDSG
jgi:hypothetical protein